MAGEERGQVDPQELREGLNKASIDFLLTDVGIGLTFASVAATTEEPETRERNVRNARKAYDYIHSQRDKHVLTEAQHQSLNSQLRELKGRLEALGETF